MQNLDKLQELDGGIFRCLRVGQIVISNYSQNLCAVLREPSGKEIVRVYSDRGVLHLLLCLTGTAFGSTKVVEKINEDYPYSLNPATTSSVDRLLLENNTRIYLAGDVVEVDYHMTTMPTPDSMPGSHYKRGSADRFSEAMKNMMVAIPIPEVCLTQPYY